MDIQSRKLRYFVAVADELHFSRAAAQLHLAQQALSKQIREIEDEVGAQLFVRTTRSVQLTSAGKIFLKTARSILTTLDAGVTATQRAGRAETGTLQVGFGLGAALELTAPILTEFSTRHPGIEVDLREFPLTEPSAGLVEGWSDLAFVRPPLGEAELELELELETLFVEPRVVGLSRTHELAGRDSVSVHELLNEPVTVARSADGAWRDFWTLAEYRVGRPAPKLKFTSSHTEEIEFVSAGLACTITVAAAARYTPHVGVRYVPITDIVGSAVALGWRRDRRNALIDRFLAVAREVRDQQCDLVRGIENPSTLSA